MNVNLFCPVCFDTHEHILKRDSDSRIFGYCENDKNKGRLSWRAIEVVFNFTSHRVYASLWKRLEPFSTKHNRTFTTSVLSPEEWRGVKNKLFCAPQEDRKAQPLYAGCLNYFPDALLAVSKLSKLGNDKHNPGQPLHWSKDKSNDHADCIARHLLDHGTIDPDTGLSHTVAVAWRALALLQTEIEKGRNDGSK